MSRHPSNSVSNASTATGGSTESDLSEYLLASEGSEQQPLLQQEGSSQNDLEAGRLPLSGRSAKGVSFRLQQQQHLLQQGSPPSIASYAGGSTGPNFHLNSGINLDLNSPLNGGEGLSSSLLHGRFSLIGMSLYYQKKDKTWALILIGAFTLFVVLSSFLFGVLVAKFGVLNGEYNSGPPVRNVIFMISDGFGPASQTAARNYRQVKENLDYGSQLALDTILVGSSRTRSSSSLVTDSAAGATAFACGLKSYNGAIGVDSKGKPCGTVLEAAKDRGLLTGLVATSRITHATPASFSAHVIGREDESAIALQQLGNYSLGRKVDLLFGGGKCYFLPSSDPLSCRSKQDLTNPLDLAKEYGWTVGSGLADFEQQSTLPLLNLFTLDHMDYEIDRSAILEVSQPSISDMARRAITLMDTESKNRRTGFFLMIEGSRIDMAGHSNDPATHIQEILAYNDAIAIAKEYVNSNPDTLLISTSDHETGGLAVAHQLGASYPIYAWSPEELFGVTRSASYIAGQLSSQSVFDRKTFIVDILYRKWLGIADTPEADDLAYFMNSNLTALDYEYRVGKIMSDRAMLGWATHGHSAVDVNLYAYGARSREIAGNHENTDIGAFIKKFLHLDLDSITKKLREQW